MLVFRYKEPPIDNNNYLLIDEDSREAALIDCSFYTVFDEIKEVLEKYSATLRYILLTHGHFDHIAGIKDGIAEVVMHKNDLKILSQANSYLPMFGISEIKIPKIDKYIDEGDIIRLGNQVIQVLHTPGHTQGGVCYFVDGKLFSGDTIFREAVGRCDMEGGDFDQLVENIKTKIFTLPSETVIYPGHGDDTTVGWEKLHNKFL